ncbi:hypothetical protein NCAS_0G01740 [Naumovozyma castellii]|uniref:Uncharacterized protein n=1 Tax=Naumovozyma castellii TaxID=27288 RepID=G0VI27_NAUCA|nr:hypothetical protein NCAS_0G01740 [Naumovozyma castellii CBS 4309]CCC71061.1 hypothetical protein NCAS_0G01740 [Naumovozyma castellii CBS 4309]
MNLQCDNGLKLVRHLDDDLTLVQRTIQQVKYSLLHVVSFGFNNKLENAYRAGFWKLAERMDFYITFQGVQQNLWRYILRHFIVKEEALSNVSPEEMQWDENLFKSNVPVLSLYGPVYINRTMYLSCPVALGLETGGPRENSHLSSYYRSAKEYNGNPVHKFIYPKYYNYTNTGLPNITKCIPPSPYSAIPFPVVFFECREYHAIIYRDLLVVYRQRAIRRGLEPTVLNVVRIFREPPYEILVQFLENGEMQYVPVYHDEDVTPAEIECYHQVFLWKLRNMTRSKLDFETFEEFKDSCNFVSEEDVSSNNEDHFSRDWVTFDWIKP